MRSTRAVKWLKGKHKRNGREGGGQREFCSMTGSREVKGIAVEGIQKVLLAHPAGPRFKPDRTYGEFEPLASPCPPARRLNLCSAFPLGRQACRGRDWDSQRNPSALGWQMCGVAGLAPRRMKWKNPPFSAPRGLLMRMFGAFRQPQGLKHVCHRSTKA